MDVQQKQKPTTTGTTVTQPPRPNKPMIDRVAEIEKKLADKEKEDKPKEKEKSFNWPVRWQFKFGQAKRKNKMDQILLLILSRKNELIPPVFVPMYDDYLVWKDKVYRYNPKAVITIRVRGRPPALFIREIDMEPISNEADLYNRDPEDKILYAVSNEDADEVREAGRSTENHKLLLKAALLAQLQKKAAQVNMFMIIIMVLLAIGGFIWFLSSG